MRSVQAIRRKYGVNCYKRWGKMGGNEILNAIGQGYKVSIHKTSKHK